MMDDDDGWQLLPKPPKRLKKTCFERCSFCQTSNDVLRTAKPSSIEKVISALKIRQDEVSQRLSPNDLQGTEEKAILWHSSCYEAYTSKQNLRYLHVKRNLQVVLLNHKLEDIAYRLIGRSAFFARMQHGKRTES